MVDATDEVGFAGDAVLDWPIDATEVSQTARRTLDDVVATVFMAHGIREEALHSKGRSRRYGTIRTENAVLAL
ncbi:MAG: hypothetical protein O7G83_05630, partial [Proteobacteria bacterium]|nr:hypothetical protein [Pseudomonadota bacterium]